MKPTCRWLVPENTSTAVPRYRRYIGDISAISRTNKVRYLTVTFNITFPRCFVAKLRLLEFALHQDVVINYFNRRLIQNTADIISKCVARLQNAAIPITKCATFITKCVVVTKWRRTQTIAVYRFSHIFKDPFSLAMISKQEFSTINQENFYLPAYHDRKKRDLLTKSLGIFLLRYDRHEKILAT